MPVQTKHKVAGGGLTVAGAALAAVLIPFWESGGRMDTTVRQQSFDPKGVYTVCDGITNLDPDYAWIRPGMKFTEPQCAEAFKKVLPKYVEPLADCMPSYPSMPPHRQAALASVSYNLGPARVCNGAIARELNAGNVETGCNAIGQYTKAAGRVLKGLENRRFDPKWGEIAWCKRKD